jgi:hypothetical protein
MQSPGAASQWQVKNGQGSKTKVNGLPHATFLRQPPFQYIETMLIAIA